MSNKSSKQFVYLLVVVAITMLVFSVWDIFRGVVGLDGSQSNAVVVELPSELFAAGVEELLQTDSN